MFNRTTLTALLAATALLVSATSAAARPITDDVQTSSLAGTTSYQDLRSPDAQDAARGDEIAAQMRTFTPAPIVVSEPAPVPADDTPWAAIAGSVALAFVLGAGGAFGLMYLRRTRPSTLARS